MILKSFIHKRQHDRAAGAILVFAVLMLVVMVGMSLYRFKRMEQDLKLQTALADQRSASFAVEYVYQEAVKALEYGFRSERSLATSFPIDVSIYKYVFTNKSSETCSGCFDLTLSREFSSAELDLNPGLPERAVIRIECDGQCGLRCSSEECLLSDENYQPSRVRGRVMAYRNESLESMDFNILVEKGSIFQPGVVLNENFEYSENLTGPIYLPASLDSYEAHIYGLDRVRDSRDCDSASDYADLFFEVWTKNNHSRHCDDSWSISGITWAYKMSLPLFHRSKYDYSEFVSDYGVTSRLLDHFLKDYHKTVAKSPYDLALDDDDDVVDVVDGADLGELSASVGMFCGSSPTPCKDAVVGVAACECCACDFNGDGEISGFGKEPEGGVKDPSATNDFDILLDYWGAVPETLPDEDVLWDFTKVHLQKTDFHENNPASPHLVNFQNNLKTWTDAEIIAALFSDPPKEGSGPGADPLVYLHYGLSSVDFTNILVGLGLASEDYDVLGAVYSIPSSMTYENVCVTAPGALPYPIYGDGKTAVNKWIESLHRFSSSSKINSDCETDCRVAINCASGIQIVSQSGLDSESNPIGSALLEIGDRVQRIIYFEHTVEITQAEFCEGLDAPAITIVSEDDIRVSNSILPKTMIGEFDKTWNFEKLRTRVRSYPQKIALIARNDIILDIKAMRALMVKGDELHFSNGDDFLGSISADTSGALAGLVRAQLAAGNEIEVPLSTDTIIEETIPLLISGPVVADQIVSHRLAHDSSSCLILGSPILIDLGLPVSDPTTAPKSPPLDGAFHFTEIHKVIGSASN